MPEVEAISAARPADPRPASTATRELEGSLPEPVPPTSIVRRDILVRLRRDGPLSPDALAAALGASRTGILQQLRALERSGLVTRQTVRHGVGRPRHLYDVADAAQELFPSNYDGLAAGLLAAIRSVGGDGLVDDVVAARRDAIADRMRERFDRVLPPDPPLADRVRELAVIQDELGYLCEAVELEDGTVRLREHNCAIRHIAATDASVCRAELELFREVLGADVRRESHIASGDRSCTYRILGD
ncbi:MAG: helix-turn-helix transcriptional regulator [Chloroflexota bacterium]